MFLYARLVMENLLFQTTVARLHRELEPDTFPDGLERAYVTFSHSKNSKLTVQILDQKLTINCAGTKE